MGGEGMGGGSCRHGLWLRWLVGLLPLLLGALWLRPVQKADEVAPLRSGEQREGGRGGGERVRGKRRETRRERAGGGGQLVGCVAEHEIYLPNIWNGFIFIIHLPFQNLATR